MCGIVGVVAKAYNGLIKQQEETFFEMLYADALRGFDSTGVLGVENDSTFYVAKEACSAEWFIHQLKVLPAKEVSIVSPMYSRGKAWVGHNRKKTSGKVADETAHPFVVDKTFSMVHNGTLHNHQVLANTEVDSQALAIHLKKAFDEGGEDAAKLKEALEEALGTVFGAYACVLYDQKRHMLHLLRNKERPLFLIETENAWYFMSEPLMGAWVLCRNNYKYDSLKAEAVPEHMLISFDLNNNKITREQLTPKKSPTPSSNQGRWGMGGNTGRTNGVTRGTNATAGSNVTFMEAEKELKRFRKVWIGQRITFWPDDFLEKNFPRSIDEDNETEVTIMGGHEDIKYAHNILAEVDLGQLGIRWSEDITTRKWTGVVETVDRTSSGAVQIWLKSCKPMVDSISKKTNVTDAIELSAKESKLWRSMIEHMLKADLEELYEKKKYALENWQITAINCELAFRNTVQSVEQAAKIAKDRDHCIIEQKVIKGKFVFVNNEGRIYYETAIAVH